MSDYILTYTQKKFYPLEPERSEIDLVDIAHALSLMTRANGHFKHFYSVAQHSINCCIEAKARGYSPRVQLACLLHDASECYLSDITRPVKQHLPEYQAIENTLQHAIYEHFGLNELTAVELEWVRVIDDAMLHHEFKAIQDVELFEDPPELVSMADFEHNEIQYFESLFKAHFYRLSKALGPVTESIDLDPIKPEPIPPAQHLIDLERKFCEATQRDGAAGWAKFFAPHGAMVGSVHPPIVGPEAIEATMAAFFGTPGTKLVWSPMKADWSADGTLGYTYGYYQRTVLNEEGQPVESTGKYMTIWKLQPDGQWLIEADIGN